MSEDKTVEMVPLDKVAEFLARNYEPPYWFKAGEAREWKQYNAPKYPVKEAWKSLLRALTMEEEENGCVQGG